MTYTSSSDHNCGTNSKYYFYTWYFLCTEYQSDYGFRQSMQIAIKALSPGINNPGTATICLHELGDL
ncbi:MAG TPA: DUF2254 family protein, partial [Segetibacter sp.]|nr:DUF2254 family protein [Segetibacter sp.]